MSSSIADFAFNSVSLSEGIIQVSQSIRCDFPSDEVRHRLQMLTEEARSILPKHLNQVQQLEALISLFFKSWGFGGASGVYHLSDALWLDKVLDMRQGTPASLGTIFLHIAQQLKLPVVPVIFPTQLILRVEWLDGEAWLINPLNGEILDSHTLDVWLRGNLGPGAHLENTDLDEADNIVVVRKMLETLKAALMEEKQMELALRVSETILCFDPEDPYEIRDRGLIYAQLDCNHVAISDLNYFIQHCPEDPVSELIKIQLHSIDTRQITIH